MKTAAVLAIGNELLSGKTRDSNMHYLAGELRRLGVALRLSLFVRDEEEEIVEALHYARRKADLVLTTGGVGPTHDDVTLSAVARAFGRPLVREPRLVDAIREYYGERVNPEVLRMAEVPEGAELLQPAPFFVPVFRVENVYCFPGVPEACRLLFDAWKEVLRQSPFHSLRCELDVEEGDLAPLLQRLQAEFPALELGSYPRFGDQAPYRVLVTVEGKDRPLVDRAGAALIDQLRSCFGDDALLRVVHPDTP
ncbi:MAG: competence/damage-inducible protein A [Planctomycetota bacterium]|nr:MAG: competence/damage-inducible protein A [Planctomycetota bacterium]